MIATGNRVQYDSTEGGGGGVTPQNQVTGYSMTLQRGGGGEEGGHSTKPGKRVQ